MTRGGEGSDPGPYLTVQVGSERYAFDSSQAPVTIGRLDPQLKRQADIPIADNRISGTHLVLDYVNGQWTATDRSRNGVFIDGHPANNFVVTERLVVTLGHPQFGITIRLGFETTTTPGQLRLGAAITARLAELNISRRNLAAKGVISAGVLAAIEHGQSQPRPATMAKLEDALGWQRGHMNALLYADDGAMTTTAVTQAPANAADAERTELLSTTSTADYEGSGVVAMLGTTVKLALAAYRTQIDTLRPDSAEFPTEAASILSALRELDAAADNAMRSAPPPAPAETVTALAAVRKMYRELMLLAARSPHATGGQRLFAARDSAGLSLDDAATMAGVSAQDMRVAENDGALPDTTAEAINKLRDTLTAVP